jgi:hypothetical protein
MEALTRTPGAGLFRREQVEAAGLPLHRLTNKNNYRLLALDVHLSQR